MTGYMVIFIHIPKTVPPACLFWCIIHSIPVCLLWGKSHINRLYFYVCAC